MYEVREQTIRFSNGNVVRFSHVIAEVLEFDEVLVIRLAADFETSSQNVFGYNSHGELLWKMPAPKTHQPFKGYVALLRKGNFVEAMNWDGHLVTLDPKKGFILGEGVFVGGSSNGRHRTPAPRRWI